MAARCNLKAQVHILSNAISWTVRSLFNSVFSYLKISIFFWLFIYLFIFNLGVSRGFHLLYNQNIYINNPGRRNNMEEEATQCMNVTSFKSRVPFFLHTFWFPSLWYRLIPSLRPDTTSQMPYFLPVIHFQIFCHSSTITYH